MLTAITPPNPTTLEAAVCHKGGIFVCPQCKCEVVLKKGRVRIAHFAHKPPIECVAGVPETAAHYRAKLAIRDGLRKRGLTAELEKVILSTEGDRRADVAI